VAAGYTEAVGQAFNITIIKRPIGDELQAAFNRR
jgi:hypothetical protein